MANAIFIALDKTPQINYIPTPEDIRDKYQHFTEAKMEKTHKAGYDKPFYELEDAVADYVQNYLMQNASF